MADTPADRERFRALWREHAPAVRAYAARRVEDPQSADDVLSETFLVCWRRLGAVPGGGAALPWLYGVARKVLANQRRSRRRADRLRARLEAAQAVAAQAGDSEAAAAALVAAATARLPELDREVLRLALWEGLDYRQIGAVLGRSENAVAVRMHRARRALRVELDRLRANVGGGPAGAAGRETGGPR